MPDDLKVGVIGATGFIGRGLGIAFAARGARCTGVSRGGARSIPGYQEWRAASDFDPAGFHAVLNLAGESIAKRWTTANKLKIRESRVDVTRRLVERIAGTPEERRPKVLVNGSAIGIYGDRGDERLADDSPSGDGFLAELCRDWEAAAMAAAALGVRVVCLRTGVVLGRDGEAFGKLLRVFRTGLAGRLGNGRQWMPWIHVDDHRAAMVHAVFSATLTGPINVCAPFPERNRDFTRKFAGAVRRPAVLPVPGIALRLVLGGFGGALLEGQRSMPKALLADGFAFRFPTLGSALADLVG